MYLCLFCALQHALSIPMRIHLQQYRLVPMDKLGGLDLAQPIGRYLFCKY